MTLDIASTSTRSNIRLAIDNWRQAFGFAILWGTVLAFHAAGKLVWSGWQDMHSIFNLTLLIFIGTAIGGAIGWLVSIWFGAHRVAPKRLATSLVCILLFTVGFSALLFAFQYRLYYSQWHMPAFSVGWFFQVFFTSLSALYLFAVQGLRVLLPFAPLALLIAAFTFTKIAPTNRN